MISGRILALATAASLLLLPGATARPGGGPANMKGRVLDLLFRPVVISQPFFSKMTLRYSDSGAQFVVVTYPAYPPHPGGQAEVISYTIHGMRGDDFSRFISKEVAEHPGATAQTIADKLKVVVSRCPISYPAFSRLLEALKGIRASPALTSRVVVDEYSQYQFRYDTGQESVRYTVVGPSEGDDSAQSKLVHWMIEFRRELPGMEEASLSSR